MTTNLFIHIYDFWDGLQNYLTMVINLFLTGHLVKLACLFISRVYYFLLLLSISKITAKELNA